MIRLVLEEAGVLYDNKIIRGKDDLAELRDSGKLSFGQLPYYEVQYLLCIHFGCSG